jgi:hypothetical protein
MVASVPAVGTERDVEKRTAHGAEREEPRPCQRTVTTFRTRIVIQAHPATLTASAIKARLFPQAVTSWRPSARTAKNSE